MSAPTLVYLTNVKYGGFVSYTAHLWRCMGRPVPVMRPGARTQQKFTSFDGRVPTQIVSLRDLCTHAEAGPVLITACYWRQYGRHCEELLKRGAAIVLHDPTEYDPELLAAIRRHGSKVVSIRRCNVDNLLALDVPNTYVPHPYHRSHPAAAPLAEREVNGVAISRLDWDKHTDTIIKANTLLPDDQRVELWGEGARPYLHHKLDKDLPGWRDQWRGRFPRSEGAAARIAATARWVVDMSAIKKDGGGTQYTHLEAWDAGCGLMLSQAWNTGSADSVGDAAVFVDGARALADAVVQAGPLLQRVNDAGQQRLEQHSGPVVVPKLIEAIQ